MMTNNTANPTGDESAKAAFVRMAKSAVRGLITGATFLTIIYSIGYLFSIPVSISFAIIWALFGATVGACRYLRFVWAWIIFMLSALLSSPLFFTYPGWRFLSALNYPGWRISALVFVLLLTIAGAGWGGRWTVLARPRPPGWFQ